MINLSICIITYRRPQGLRRLLEGINALQFAGSSPELEVIVVDNDAAGQACQTCQDVSLRWPLRCVVEPRQGIPLARNRAVREAESIGTDFIAFIDDDEVPDPVWLDELLRAQERFEADLVAGPVIPHFPTPPPEWVLEGQFFERPRHPTGHKLRAAASNNLLLRASILQSVEGPFDEQLRYTGGSDTRLTRLLTQRGYTIVWADKAVVREWVPSHRLRPSWILQRAYRGGNGFAMIESLEGASIQERLIRALKGAAHIIQGVLRGLTTGLFTKASFLQAISIVYHGAGMITGALEVWYEEYRPASS